ncbi:MAG: hypothetical protein K2I10_09130 [Lachnospiraceae bacterium]|nr:hypothetical protein [Lachnospiraceae bacterium]
MKISNSAVAMQSSHRYSRYQETHVSSVLVRSSVLDAVKKESGGASVSISDESRSLLKKLQAKKEEMQKDQQENLYAAAEQSGKSTGIGDSSSRLSDKNEQMLKTLKRILAMLKKMRKGSIWASGGIQDYLEKSISEMESKSESRQFGISSTFGITAGTASVVDLRSVSSVSAGSGTKWIRHTEKSGFIMEQESTSFSAKGLVHTSDGREIEFGVELNMSRGFAGEFFESSDVEAILTDPLVINLESGSATVSDQKFYFDLDCDGEKEEISALGRGSGFLAYDKNGDGVINDGSELFGTKSGNGFADLAAYDEDGNGWIDENDSIYNKLKVWTKSEDGTDRLLNLKEADVGAIYLGNTDTQFSLNNEANNTNAVIRRTGVFLKESGGAGTVQHLDLAV